VGDGMTIGEELFDYDPNLKFEEADDELGDYTNSNNMYPDVAFFWFGLSSFILAALPMSMYITFLGDINSIPIANEDKYAE
jgi:hypothetical protein